VLNIARLLGRTAPPPPTPVEAEPTFDISNDCLSRYISWAGMGGNIRNPSFIKRVKAFFNSWIKWFMLLPMVYASSNSLIKWFMFF
jgi:hypothetical protein